jgi:hypothetical protein
MEHATDRCTGSWSLTGGRISCGSCGRSYPATPENRRAAVEENFVGELLERAAREGARLRPEENDS